MKKIIAFVLVMASLHSYAQSKKNNINETVSDAQLMEALKDTTIAVEYVNKSKSKPVPRPAYFVNGRFSSDLESIQPDLIERINVQKRDTIIAGEKYAGMVFIKLKHHPNKDKYVPKMISLNQLKNDYTTLKNQPALFTIDGKLINANYNFYKVDKNTILKIVVEKFSGNANKDEMWLVKLLTKTKENIRRSKQTWIRGAPGLVKN
jgi:hypothetical protein